MALESHRYRGTARNGKIELEAGANVPDGAEVIVLFEPSAASARERDLAWKRLKSAMKRGHDLGGGPYRKREDIYGDTGRPH